MKTLLNKLFVRRPIRPRKAPDNRVRLNIESLEARDNPSTTVVSLIQGTVYIWADSVGSNITISRPSLASNLKVTDNQTKTTWTFNQGILDHTPVVFYGSNQVDKVTAAGAMNPVTLNGNGGNDEFTGGLFNDKIFGGAGNDLIRGGAGDDFILGGAGNDALFGQAGIDYVDGEANNDFLDDGGSAADVSKGGSGFDFFAKKTVVNGTTANDIDQDQTPTCWLLAPLAAAAKAGINLAGRITYQDKGVYQVKLLLTNGSFELQKVSLIDGMQDGEPTPHDEESWVVLYQRAIIQALGKASTAGGWADECVSYLTGRAATHHGGNTWTTPEDKSLGGKFATWGDAEMTVIKNELAAGHLVLATTRVGNYGDGNYGGDVSTAKLIGEHVYSIESINMNARTITMRNPWGHDVGADGIPTGDPDDALVTITFDQFYASMWNYTTS